MIHTELCGVSGFELQTERPNHTECLSAHWAGITAYLMPRQASPQPNLADTFWQLECNASSPNQADLAFFETKAMLQEKIHRYPCPLTV
jgi:hypothetical protein